MTDDLSREYVSRSSEKFFFFFTINQRCVIVCEREREVQTRGLNEGKFESRHVTCRQERAFRLKTTGSPNNDHYNPRGIVNVSTEG